MLTLTLGRYCRVDFSKFPAEKEYAVHVASLADEVMPKIRAIHTGRNPGDKITFVFERNEEWMAATNGKTVSLNLDHFDKIAKIYGAREADDGAIVHEISHAILWAPAYDNSNVWLIEGIADYVRNKLGFQREAKGDVPGSYPHFEKDKALSGYQTTAHFLVYLEELRATVIKDLAEALVNDTYNENIFQTLFGKSLWELIDMYEKRNETKRGGLY